MATQGDDIKDMAAMMRNMMGKLNEVVKEVAKLKAGSDGDAAAAKFEDEYESPTATHTAEDFLF